MTGKQRGVCRRGQRLSRRKTELEIANRKRTVTNSSNSNSNSSGGSTTRIYFFETNIYDLAEGRVLRRGDTQPATKYA